MTLIGLCANCNKQTEDFKKCEECDYFFCKDCINENNRCENCDDKYWEAYADNQYDEVDFGE